MHEEDISLLEIYTPEKIIEDFSKKEESTKDLLDLINSTSPNPIKLKKLSKIFTSLSNCDHFSFIELTKSKNRNLRLISTFLIFSKMCDLVKENSNFELVSSLYKEVFLVRYRDVDPNIRGLCLDFIIDWIIISPKVFCTNTYLKYLGMYLSDKSDLVRKKSILGFIKLIDKNLVNEDLLDKNIKRIIEMSSNDKNNNIREESSKLILISFNKNLIEKEKVYPVLKKGIKDSKKMNEAVWGVIRECVGGEGKNVDGSKVGKDVDGKGKEGKGEGMDGKENGKEKGSKEGKDNSIKGHNEYLTKKPKKPSNYKNVSLVPYFDNLHDLFLNTSHLPFTYLIFDRQDLDSLVQYTIQSYEESEFCCNKPTNCYLEILSIFKLEKVSQALYLFKTFKNSLENTKIIFKSVLDLPLESFKNEVKITINLLDDFFEFVYVNRNKVYDGSKVEDGSRVDNKVEEKDDSKVERNCNFNNNPKSPFYPSIYSILDSFFLILKKLQNDFESKIDFYLERSQSEIPLRFFGIRSFDLSKSISKEDYSETKIFACLWFILNKDFKKIEEITLEKHLEIREILELLFFIKSKIYEDKEGYEGRDYNEGRDSEGSNGVRDHNEGRDYNEDFNDHTNSSLFKIFFLIKNYLKVNYKDLLFPSFTPYFFRFLEENVLKDLFHLTFTFMDLEDFKNKFTKMKNKEKVIEEYFKFLEKIEVKDECDGVNDDHKLDNNKDIIHLNSSLIYDLEDFTLKGISEVGESRGSEIRDERGSKWGLGKGSRSTLNHLTPLNPTLPHPTINHPTTPNPITLPQNTKDHIYSFSLILKSKFLKDNLVFRSLKSFIEKNLENLYDTVCIHFVSHLNSNECIILDSKLKTKCKFKNLLGKKCKDPKMGSEGSTTYI